MGKEAIGAESEEYFSYMGFVPGDVICVDEYVQVNDDNDVNHIHEGVVPKLLKS